MGWLVAVFDTKSKCLPDYLGHQKLVLASFNIVSSKVYPGPHEVYFARRPRNVSRARIRRIS
jgi:hypothetical protein